MAGSIGRVRRDRSREGRAFRFACARSTLRFRQQARAHCAPHPLRVILRRSTTRVVSRAGRSVAKKELRHPRVNQFSRQVERRHLTKIFAVDTRAAVDHHSCQRDVSGRRRVVERGAAVLVDGAQRSGWRVDEQNLGDILESKRDRPVQRRAVNLVSRRNACSAVEISADSDDAP